MHGFTVPLSYITSEKQVLKSHQDGNNEWISSYFTNLENYIQEAQRP